MAKFTFTSPDGSKYTVNGPDGATEEQAWTQLQTQLNSKSSKADSFSGGDHSKDGMMTQFLGGAKHSLDSAALGLKDMLPKGVQDFGDSIDKALGMGGVNKNLVDQGSAYVDKTGAASSIGKFGGDAAMFVGAGLEGAAAKGLTLLPRAMGAIGAALGSGATAGVITPGNWSDKGTAAIETGAGQLVGEGVLGAASKYLGGIFKGTPVTQEAKNLMDKGIDVPRWKQAPQDSAFRAKVEGLRALPHTGSAVKAQERQAMEQWAQTMIDKATPGGNKVSLGPDMMEDLAKVYNKGYGQIYKGQVVPDELFHQKFNGILDDTANYFPEDIAAVNGIARKIGDEVLGVERHPNWGVGFDAIKRGIGTADDAIKAAWMKGDATRANQYEAMRDTLTALRNRSVPEDMQGQLVDLNKAYTAFKPIQRANSMLGAQTSGVFSPSQVLSAIKAGDRTPGKAAFSRQKMPLQKEVLEAQKVLGSSIPEVGPGTAEKLLAAEQGWIKTARDMVNQGLYTTGPGQKFLLGELPGQAAIAQALRANKFTIPAIDSVIQGD